MELNKQQKKDLKGFVVPKVPDLTDVTILNTPMPQASSTVDRRSLVQGKTRRSNLDEQNSKHRQLNFDCTNTSQNSEESSLGIINNISTLLDDSSMDHFKSKKDCPERVRELARKLIKKSNDQMISNVVSKPDKENNVNISNLLKKINDCTSPKSTQLTNSVQNQRQPIEDKKSTSTDASVSIVFEPTEMSARSSELNKTPEKTEPFPSLDHSGISYNSNLAAMIDQFGDEEFLSGSKAGSQMMADELSWRKEKLAAVPLVNDRDRLELSCFSGIIGDAELTVDGGRVSIGEFFRKKCGATGHLSITSASDRPSFGLDVKSPQRQGKLRPLVDQSVTTEEGKESKSADCTKDPSVMSLSSIAQILQDIESGTPMKLVDQIMDANKKKRKPQLEENNSISNTYTVLSTNRASLPVSTTFSKDKIPKNANKISPQNTLRNKLSLGSKSLSERGSKSFKELLNEADGLDPKIRKLIEMNLDDTLEDTLNAEKMTETTKNDRLSLDQHQSKYSNASVPRAESFAALPARHLSSLSPLLNIPNKFNSTSINNNTNLIHDTGPSDLSDPTLNKSELSVKEDTLTNSNVKNQSFETKKVEIGKKTQELCTCLVGIPREADFELYNGTDRWILCSLKLHQIQGEKNNIKIDLPNENILIEPDARKSFKIDVMMPRMGKLTIAILHIPCSDMVTRTSWYMKHLMCFVPEEPSIKISTPSEDGLNFQMITEDTSNSLPITVENKNSIDVPVFLILSQNKPELFSIGECLDDTAGSVSYQKESVYLVLKPRQPLILYIDFRGMSLQSFGEKALQKGLHEVEANLRISICFKENEEYLIKDIPLKGVLAACKLDIVGTQFPLLLPARVDRIINLKNSGSIAVSATADIVQSKENQTECRDFFLCPNNIVLNGGERLALQIAYKPENNKTENEKCAMLRLIVGNKISFYPVIGEKAIETEQFASDSFLQMPRSETPQYLRNISSPSSPHSLIFNRSGVSGRHSPGSSASGGTAVGTVIPIKATRTALVWGSVRAGKSDTKQLTIRNTSNTKIKLLVNIKSEDQNFKFLKDRSSVVSSMTVSLQGMESKTLSIIFSPNYPRAAAGKIIFSHYNARETREISGIVKTVKLYGYGGCGKMEISEAVKDTSGQMWLSLGKLNSDGLLHAKVKLHNSGDLTCFAKVKLNPKAFYPSVASSWHIEPTELLLAPNETQWILLEFRPKKDDIVTQQTGVVHVGTLKITHGDEPTRLRIRRLYKKLKDSEQLHEKIDDQADEFKKVIHQISKAFPGEVFTPDLKLIGDSVNNLGDLCKGIIQNEVKLTVEIHADETISMLHDNMDDSQIFYSLCSDNDTESHFGGESFMPTD